MLEAFSHFQDYLIIWRLEGEMPNGLEQQKHIKIVTWMPQKDLLGDIFYLILSMDKF